MPTRGLTVEAAKARHDAMMVRQVDATRWYMALPTITTKSFCGVCAEPLLTPAGLHALHLDAPKKAPAQLHPFALERRYQRILQRRVRQVHKLVLEALRRELKPIAGEINERAGKRDRADAARLAHVGHAYETGPMTAEDVLLAEMLVGLRLDSQASDTNRLLRVVAFIEKGVKATLPDIESGMVRVATSISKFTTGSVLRTVPGLAVAPDVLATAVANTNKLIDAWQVANSKLIGSLDARYFDDIKAAVKATVGEGKSTRSLSKSLQERLGVAKARADLIAVDQVGTLNAEITKARQSSLGIEEYTWTNVGDDRVREAHRNAPTGLGQTVQRWDTPVPGEGFPGEPIRCRCTAVAIIPS